MFMNGTWMLLRTACIPVRLASASKEGLNHRCCKDRSVLDGYMANVIHATGYDLLHLSPENMVVSLESGTPI